MKQSPLHQQQKQSCSANNIHPVLSKYHWDYLSKYTHQPRGSIFKLHSRRHPSLLDWDRECPHKEPFPLTFIITFQVTDPDFLLTMRSLSAWIYLWVRTCTHKESQFLCNLQTNLPNRDVLASLAFLIPRPPSFLGLVIFSQPTKWIPKLEEPSPSHLHIIIGNKI